MILEAGASSPSGSSGSGAPGPIADRVEPVGGLPEVKKGVSRRRAVLVANLLIAGIGLVPILLAAAADRDWADRHFLPTFAWSQGAQQDLILGDDDGVLCVPFGDTATVLEAARKKHADEERSIAAIKGGTRSKAWVDQTLERLGCFIET